jgi:hypothetical protein
MKSNLVNEAIRTDTAAWWETYGKIFPKDRKRGLIKPVRNYLQVKTSAVVTQMLQLRIPVRIVGLKPRQRGSTTYFCAEGYAKCRREATSYCIIAGQATQTQEAWDMVKVYHKNDGFPDWGNNGSINEEAGKFTNGSKLKKETAGDKHAGIAGTYQCLHVTELGRWSEQGVANAGEVLANILKCVPLESDTMVFIESTAEGDTGEFPTRFNDAITAEDFLSGAKIPQPGEYVSVFAGWFEFEDSAIRLNDEQKRLIESSLDVIERFKGELDLIADYGQKDETGKVIRLGTTVTGFDVWEQLAWRRMAIDTECKKDPKIFDRDYPHSAEAAFQASGRPVFNKSGLKALKARAEYKAVQWGVLEPQGDRNRYVWRPTTRDEAKYKVFERPMPKRRYLVSVDMMTGASQAAGLDPDCHSVLVWRQGYWEPGPRWVKPAVVARIPGPCRWNIDILEEMVWRLACDYGGSSPCMIVPEVNMDRGLIELLKLRIGAKIYVRQQFNKREQKFETESYGWYTNAQTRATIIETLAAAIRDHDVAGKGVDIWDEEMLDQCKHFIEKESGRQEASSGKHDDDVLSGAIGLQTIGSATLYTEPIFRRPLPRDLQGLETNGRGGGSAQYG